MYAVHLPLRVLPPILYFKILEKRSQIVAIVYFLLVQIEGTSFTYTFVGVGYEKKTSGPGDVHDGVPSKKIVTKVNGPGKKENKHPIICDSQCLPQFYQWTIS